MSGIFLRWGVPALVTVIGGTALAITLAGPAMTEDLAGRTAEAIASPQFGWANVTIDGRDAILGGTATDQSAIDAALVAIAAVPGARSARSAVTLAKYVSRFPSVRSSPPTAFPCPAVFRTKRHTARFSPPLGRPTTIFACSPVPRASGVAGRRFLRHRPSSAIRRG